jgi:hypothetical protein
MDYRAMFDREYIGSWDLGNRDVTVTITRVEAKKLRNQKGENLKPVVWFDGKEKGFVCNKTNAKTIATLYGNDTEKWLGKRVTLYVTTTSIGGETMDCIRVRPTVAIGATKLQQVREPGVD